MAEQKIIIHTDRPEWRNVQPEFKSWESKSDPLDAAMAIFRAISREPAEHSQRALNLTEEIIKLSSERWCPEVWDYRFRCAQAMGLKPATELSWSWLLVDYYFNVKKRSSWNTTIRIDGQLWDYRQKWIETMYPLPDALESMKAQITSESDTEDILFFRQELDGVRRVIDIDRDIRTLLYRQWLISTYSLWKLQFTRISEAGASVRSDLVSDELSWTEAGLKENPVLFLYWHHRFFIHTRGGNFKDDNPGRQLESSLIEQEKEYVRARLIDNLSNGSAWMHLKKLVKYTNTSLRTFEDLVVQAVSQDGPSVDALHVYQALLEQRSEAGEVRTEEDRRHLQEAISLIERQSRRGKAQFNASCKAIVTAVNSMPGMD